MSEPRREGSIRFTPALVRSSIVAALGGLLFGFDTAVISGTTRAVTDLFRLTEESLGFYMSSALIGTVIGAMVAGWPGDRWGRRDSLKWVAILYLVSAIGCAVSWDFWSLVFFRWLGGLGVGASSVLGPMYLAEIAPARWRGRLVGFFQFNVVLGILVAYFTNYLVGLVGFGETEWRWKLGLEGAPAALFFLMLFTIPRSPRWLVTKGQVGEARSVLVQVGEQEVEAELAEIVGSVEAEHGVRVEPLFQRRYRWPIFLAVSIAMLNQLTGINAILYYLNYIFESAGFDKESQDLQSVAVGGTNLIFTIIAMSIIDRAGRRPLLLIGSVGVGACLAGVSYIFFSGEHKDLLVWLLVGYIAFFGFSQGAVIWVYISEVFPNRVRAKGQALGSFTHWFMCAVIAGTFPQIAKDSSGYPFALFAGMMVVQLFVVLLLYPETKGVSLEQLEHKLGIDGSRDRMDDAGSVRGSDG